MAVAYSMTQPARLPMAWPDSLRAIWRPVGLYLVPVLLGIALVGYLLVSRAISGFIDPVVDQERSVIARAEQTLVRHLGFMRRDLRLLSNRSVFNRLSAASDQAELAEELGRFLSAADLYLEARVFLEDGKELVHVFQDPVNHRLTRSNGVSDTARSFAKMMTAVEKKGMIFVGGLEWLESPRPDESRIPILRVGIALEDSQTSKRSVLVLDFDVRPMLKRMAESNAGTRKEIHVVDSEGVILIASKNAFKFDQDTDSMPEKTRLPADVLHFMQAESSSYGWTWNGGIWSHRKVTLAGALGNPSNTTMLTQDTDWHLVAELPRRFVPWTPKSVVIMGTLFTGLIGLVVAWFGFRLLIAEADRRQKGRQNRIQHQQLLHQHAELQEALAALNRAKEDLIKRETLAALGLTVAGVSHELNTPIGAVTVAQSTMTRKLECLQSLIQEGRLSRRALDDYVLDAREALALIEASMQRANGVIGMLKTLASERSSLEVDDVNLKSLVQTCVDLHRFETANSDVEVVVDIPDPMVIRTRAGALGQVISNLMTNASSHGFRDGEKGSIRVVGQIVESGRSVLIEVSDNGRGMDADTQMKVFQPFFSTRRHDGGTGLGLSICHHLVTDILDGDIQLQSTPTVGTRFSIRLPTQI